MADSNSQKMFQAIEAGNLASVRSLIEDEPALLQAIVDNADPVGWAAFYAHPAIVEYFISQKTDLNWRTPRGTTPLGFALKGAAGVFKSHGVDRPANLYQQCADLLLAAGASE
jgi:hypothetical protein